MISSRKPGRDLEYTASYYSKSWDGPTGSVLKSRGREMNLNKVPVSSRKRMYTESKRCSGWVCLLGCGVAKEEHERTGTLVSLSPWVSLSAHAGWQRAALRGIRLLLKSLLLPPRAAM